jgi:ParB/RepB/Spo0J family partition protein
MPKIGLDQIIDSENIRQDYADIEDLADSIKKRGQLEPVIVKKADVAEDGTPRYELVAGFRRLKAVQMLNEKGEGFSQIKAEVVTGDRLTIQLIENLQRSDLSAIERERGIYLMTQNGLSQKEVAAELSKKEDYISRHVSAYKIRMVAEEAGINTSKLETFTLTEIQAAKEKDIPMMVSFILSAGGTKAAARQVMKDYRGNKEPAPAPAPAPEAPPRATPEGEIIQPPADLSVNDVADVEKITDTDEPLENIDPLAGVETDQVREPPRHSKPIPRESVDPEHRVIDLQTVFDKIYAYLTALEKKIKELGPDADESIVAQYKKDAAYDIIALLHEGI